MTKSIEQTLKSSVSSLKISHNYSAASESVTVSIGACSARVNDIGDLEKVFEQADKALYLAKKNGRNCVWIV
ncbi:MAG: diguanylate cyclase [Peptococcaceae bacterium]|nr:diguanylate cyclase [Peptococcaceae bacterium]